MKKGWFEQILEASKESSFAYFNIILHVFQYLYSYKMLLDVQQIFMSVKLLKNFKGKGYIKFYANSAS